VNKLCSALALLSCSVAVSCFGTETDNPVTSNQPDVDYTSPERFGPPPPAVPPCVPPDPEEVPYERGNYNGDALLTTSSGTVLARAGELIDVSDPSAPRRLGHANIAAVYDLLAGDAGVLWVIGAEPLEISGASAPPAAALDYQLRLIQLDVSDPARPVRVAQVDLEGEPWALATRDGALWVVTRRRTAEQRACDAEQGPYSCVTPAYEALVVRGFQPTGGALEPLSSAELPFRQRAWWGSDGIVSALGTDLHVLTWEPNGQLATPRTIAAASASDITEQLREPLGPVEVVGRQLLAVRASAGLVALDIHDLDSAGPPRSFPLGEIVEPHVGRSVFFGRHLWLQSRLEGSRAELWDLSGGEPARVALPGPYSVALPVALATRPDAASGEQLALAWETSNGRATLLSLREGTASVIETIDEYIWSPDLDYGSSEPAPSSIVGPGSLLDYRLDQPGQGLPLVIQPSVVVPSEPRVRDSAAVLSADGAVVQATLQDGAQLELVVAGASVPFELSPGTSELLATRTHVVALDTTDLSRCQQTGEDCSQQAPGVRIFSASGEPGLVASLPLPALPLPASTPPSRLSVSWELYDELSRTRSGALELDAEKLALVATVDMSCDTPEDCEALGIEAIPFAEANVVGGATVACPPEDIDPDCVPTVYSDPAVYGSSQRQFFFVLDVGAPGGPAWQTWGQSSLESSTARRDQGGFSRFAAPIASDGVLAATRLERASAAGELLPAGTSRFMLDRFALDAQGTPRALPPVNVPGYPLARLRSSENTERWLAVEAAPGESGHGRLLRLAIEGDRARVESELELDAGRFGGARVVESERARIALVLLAPDNACGTTQLAASAVSAGDASADAAVDPPLALSGSIELPEDDWTFADSDGPYVLLGSFPAYVLVHVAPDGSLSVTGSTTAPEVRGDLIGTTLYTALRRLDLAP
jgi:hypothetical protein